MKKIDTKEKKIDAKKLIRTVYMYLVTAITIVMILIAGVSMIKTGLEAYVFNVSSWDYGNPYYECESPKMINNTEIQRTDAEKADCTKKAEQRNKVQTSNERKRTMANAIAMVLVALPLYLYHWSVIQKENKNS